MSVDIADDVLADAVRSAFDAFDATAVDADPWHGHHARAAVHDTLDRSTGVGTVTGFGNLPTSASLLFKGWEEQIARLFVFTRIKIADDPGTPMGAHRCPAMLPTKPMFSWADPGEDEASLLLSAYIADQGFPCVGAKAAMAKGTLDILGARDIASAWDDLRIHDRLRCFAAQYRAEPSLFRSLAVVFSGPDDLSETAFERAIWQRIQSLSDKDVWLGQEWDNRVSPDPSNPHFSLSFGGEAFFVVGLHPRASRPARRFSRPTMIFNLHDQFETLRDQGKYETMREKIMVRDEALAGSRNPMLSRHGEASEARQYSGRAVNSGWQCPFRYSGA